VVESWPARLVVKEREEWLGRVRGADGRQRWIELVIFVQPMKAPRSVFDIKGPLPEQGMDSQSMDWEPVESGDECSGRFQSVRVAGGEVSRGHSRSIATKQTCD
jgi:hypothetical protein